MLALLLDKPTLAPPVKAAPLIVTVHEADPGAVTLDGVQERAVNVGDTGCVIPMAPLVADEGITLPYISVMTTPVIWIGASVSVVALMPKVAVATTPSATMLLFTPTTTQIVLPPLLAHEMLLPAEVALGPATTLTVPMSDTG
jgi:hypothetical protein